MVSRELLDSSKLRQSAYEIPSVDILEENNDEEDDLEQQVGEDFTSDELIKLKSQLSKRQMDKAINTLKANSILHSLSLYRLFALYFGIIYENEEVFNLILEEEWGEDDLVKVTRIEQQAWDLVYSNDYEKLRSDPDLKKVLGHCVMYKALDFNIKEVFSLVFEHEDSLILREEDIMTLFKYKHYIEIAKTFNKPILKRNLVDLFMEKEGNFKDELNYSAFNLNYFMEVMIRLEYSSFEIKEFSEHFMDHFNPTKAMKIFIKYDKLDLVQWTEHHNQYAFCMEQMVLSFEYNALDITKYFYLKYKKKVASEQNVLRRPIINSFGLSVLLYDTKIHFMKKFFKIFNAQDLETFLIILRDNLLSEEYDKSPFLYSLNPIRTSLLLVEILRQINKKFKIFQVRCMELEKYLEESLFKFIDGIQNEEISSFMLFEKDWDNRDSLELLSKFEFYRIIQHRNVNEVMMQIFKSKYAIELSNNPQPLTDYLLYKERILNKEDIEKKCRPPNIVIDRKNSKQSPFMFYIFRHNIMVRYNSELFFIILFTSTQIIITIFLLIYEGKNIKNNPNTILISQRDPIIYTDDFEPIIIDLCTQILDNLWVYMVCIHSLQILFMQQLGFGIRLISQFILKWKTGRKIALWTLQNIILTLLTAVALFNNYLTLRPVEQTHDPVFETCNDNIEIPEEIQIIKNNVDYYYEWESAIGILYAFNTVLLLSLILSQLQLTLQLGPLIRIIRSITYDMLIMSFFFWILVEIYQKIGFFIFSGIEEFQTPTSSYQILFAGIQGNFNFSVFDIKEGQDYSFIPNPLVGKIYMISWLVISNIMMLNLLIAIFSNTYNQLQQEKYGQFLKQIIDSRPNFEYDEEYGALIIVPFPFNVLLLPFLPLYAIVQKNKYFNEIVESIFYFTFHALCALPFYLIIVIPCRALYLYIKCLLNKIYILVLTRGTGRTFCDRLTSVIMFLTIGFVYFFFYSLIDFVLLQYILMKPEEQLQLRYQRDQIKLTLEDVDWIKQFNRYIKKSKSSNEKRNFEYMKVFVSKLRKLMKIDECINKILHQGSSENDPNLQTLKVYARVKAMFVDSSIRDNDQLVIYPAMLDAVIEDINVQNKLCTITTQLTSSKAFMSDDRNLEESAIFMSSNRSSKYFKDVKRSDLINLNHIAIDGKVRSLAKHLIMAQIGNAARSFLRRDNWAQQNNIEIALKKDDQSIKQSLDILKCELQTKLNMQ